MTVYLLTDSLDFPQPELAEENGLLALGGDLGTERLLLAYKSGIFPWYSEGQPILWFSPDPRFILLPNELHISSKVKKLINSGVFEVRFDTRFTEVIHKCSEVPRAGQEGTWITSDMINAYVELHNKGYAHSVETYLDGNLVGGLYGVSLGRAFFGESMFHTASNASKVALYYLVCRLIDWDFMFIDSQVPNAHMKSLGAKEIPRTQFLRLLARALESESVVGNWGKDKPICSEL